MSEELYIVVFEYNEGVRTVGVSLAGHRFYEPFESKEAFDKYYSDDIKQRQKVIVEGVTEDKAEKIKKHLENIIDKPLINETTPNPVQNKMEE